MVHIICDNVRGISTRKRIYDRMIMAFQDADCDTLDEAKGIDGVYDERLEDVYGDEDEDFDDE